jgi:hypothetical protein
MLGSFLTPSIAGNFLGRIWYYAPTLRWKIGIHSSLANFSQSLIAICIGIPFLIYNRPQEISNLFIWAAFLLLMIFTYLFCDLLFKLMPWQKMHLIGENLLTIKIRIAFLTISFLRYLVMFTQYYMALLAFGAEISAQLIAPIALIFLFVTLTPSLFFGKIIVRESIAITVFSFYTFPLNEVFFASLLVWCLSIFIPALLALTVLKMPKIDRV